MSRENLNEMDESTLDVRDDGTSNVGKSIRREHNYKQNAGSGREPNEFAILLTITKKEGDKWGEMSEQFIVDFVEDVTGLQPLDVNIASCDEAIIYFLDDIILTLVAGDLMKIKQIKLCYKVSVRLTGKTM